MKINIHASKYILNLYNSTSFSSVPRNTRGVPWDWRRLIRKKWIAFKKIFIYIIDVIKSSFRLTKFKNICCTFELIPPEKGVWTKNSFSFGLKNFIKNSKKNIILNTSPVHISTIFIPKYLKLCKKQIFLKQNWF